MSEYTALLVVGLHAEVEIEPGDVELVMSILDDALEELDVLYRDAADHEIDALQHEIDELAGVRDALHSVAIAIDPGSGT